MKKQNFILLSDPNELVSQFKVEVENMLHSEFKVMQKSQKDISVEYLTRVDVAKRLHCSYSTIHRMVNNGGLKCYKFGRKSLFRSTDVEAVLIQLNTKGSNYAY